MHLKRAASALVEENESFASYVFGETSGVIVTCEHASEGVPEGWRWPTEDARLRGTHWAFDLGAEAVALEYAEAVKARLVCARFSRLLADPNRPEGSPTLFRPICDGVPVVLNTGITDADREARLTRLYRPLHRAIDQAARLSTTAHTLFSIHSFTPLYEGQPRTMEVGVLFDKEESLAAALMMALDDAGFAVRANEPWSGKDGLMYVADTHSAAHQKRALELEVRQDLAVDPAFRARLIPVLARVLF
jgi:predicted N-formylglutamate amidohydrolase